MTTTQVSCPNCEHLNPTTAATCENCKAVLITPVDNPDDAKPATIPIDADDSAQTISTRNIDDLRDGEEAFNTGKAMIQGDLVLMVQPSGKKFVLSGNQLNEVVLGRRNQETGYAPTVDLTDVNGQKQGVSRRHATLTRRDSLLLLIDHNSTNGTFLNGKRLAPEQPRVVRDSDMIRLGQLEILIVFQKK